MVGKGYYNFLHMTKLRTWEQGKARKETVDEDIVPGHTIWSFDKTNGHTGNQGNSLLIATLSHGRHFAKDGMISVCFDLRQSPACDP